MTEDSLIAAKDYVSAVWIFSSIFEPLHENWPSNFSLGDAL